MKEIKWIDEPPYMWTITDGAHKLILRKRPDDKYFLCCWYSGHEVTMCSSVIEKGNYKAISELEPAKKWMEIAFPKYVEREIAAAKIVHTHNGY